MKNQVIKVLNKEHGKKVIQFWKDRGVDTKGSVGSINEEDGDKWIYYGVINGEFDNYCIDQVQYYNAEIMIFFPKEEKNTPSECSICDLAEGEKLLILDENVDVKQERVLYDKSKKEEPIFKVGDKVYDYQHGWGEVVDISQYENDEHPIQVDFLSDMTEYYNNKGCLFNKTKMKTLSFTEYTLQGFSQERPIPEVGELCLFYDHGCKEEYYKCGFFKEYEKGNTHPYRTTDNDGYQVCKRIKILD